MDADVETSSAAPVHRAMLDLRQERLVALIQAADGDQAERTRGSIFKNFGQLPTRCSCGEHDTAAAGLYADGADTGMIFGGNYYGV